MSQRSVDVKIGADTSGFLTGISDVVAKLNVLNKQMLESQAATKKINQEMREYEKEQAKIQKEIKESGSATDEQKEKLAKLEQKLDEARSRAAELKTEQSKLKSEIKSASKELDEQTEGLNKVANAEDGVKQATDEMKVSVEKSSEGFTVMKGAISNLVSDALNTAVDKFKEMAVSSEQALNSLQVKTGMSTEAVSELKDEMYAIYKDNFGDSLTDVADKIALVAQNIDESDPSKIKSITENAIGLSDAFGSDFEENLRGVNGLMTNMGLTAEEAFDYIAKGSQNGLDKTHELTDNLAEYSQIWSQAGFSVEEMFSILQNGLDSGAYNLDKVNDFVKEFAISLADGRIAENISSFSNESKNLFEEWKSGKATQADVFQSIISDLSNMTNQQEALTLASTVWSSLGEDNAMSVLTSLNKVNDKYTDVAGTMQEINDIQYNDAGSQIEALGRQFEVDILQPIVNGITPSAKEIISFVSKSLPQIVSLVAALVTGTKTYKSITTDGAFLNSIINGFKQLKTSTEAATTAQLANNAAVNANPYVAVASILVGLVSLFATYSITANNMSEETDNASDSLKDYTQIITDTKNAMEDKKSQTESDIQLTKTLKSEYDELRKKTNLTASEQSELDFVAKQLAETLGINTNSLKEQSGAYKDLTANVDDYVESLKNQAIYEANEENFKAAAQAVANTKKEYEKAEKSYDEYIEKMRLKSLEAKSKGKSFLIPENDTNAALSVLGKGESISDILNSLISLPNDKIKEYDFFLEKVGGSADEVIKLKNSISEYSKQQSEAESALEECDAALRNSYKTISNHVTKVKELNIEFSDLIDLATVAANAEKEYDETGRLSISTLQSIISKYPELENSVFNYMIGLTDAKSVIESMQSTYYNDAEAFLKVQISKNANNTDFYKNVMLANTEWVNDCKNKYNIDLTNYATWAQARSNITSKIIKQVSALPGIGPLLGNVLTSAQDTWFDYVLSQYTSKFVTTKDSFLNLNNINNSNDEKDKKDKIKKLTDESKKAEDTLLKKYELVEAAYNRLVDKRIERIQKEQEAKEKAKNAAIAAIDAEVEARKRLNEDKESQNELDTINARLKYEKLDELSRRELMRRKQELLNEQAETKWQRMMSDKKDKLQSSYDSYKNNSDSMIEALQRAANSAADYFDTLKSGYKTNSYIVNNNSDTRNIQIIQNALSNQQMVDKLLKAIYSK
ncbi:phage tail tape measure protein [Pseudoruminococcus massiliensis]|uniref:phage tail tape measure protein n=1 Tax=Pseudoruminococcus massiliensis TaxID=2086583 RepID=UPI000D0E7A19|nr:phage tail tape measure protein [Pseudoruminococcus massiliensis]